METEKAKSMLASLDDEINQLATVLKLVPTLYHASDDCKDPEKSLQMANIYVMVSYAIDSILFSYLKLQGVDTTSHEIMSELERVKIYMTKVKQCTDRQHGKLQQEKSSLTVDKDAASRLVKRAISSYSIEDATAPQQEKNNDKNNTGIRAGKRKKSSSSSGTSSNNKQKKKKKSSK